MDGGAWVGCVPWAHKELDRTERLHFHFSLSCIGEGNGSPLQTSCLENPRDGGAWWAAVYGVTQSWTRLKWLSSSSSMQYCSLQNRILLLSPVTSTAGYCFCFGSIPSFFLELFLHWSPSSILGTYWPGEFLFQYLIILPFLTVHGVLKARILKWFAVPFSSEPHSVRPLHHGLPVLGCPTGMA